MKCLFALATTLFLTLSAPAGFALSSGLELSFETPNKSAVENLTYSINPISGSAPIDEKRDSLRPGLYNLAVQIKGEEVFSQEIIAIDGLASRLTLKESDRVFTLRQTLSLPQIKFVPGHKQIDKASRQLLDKIAELLKNQETLELMGIEVHTDKNGDESMNVELTQARATEIRNGLVKRGVDSQRIKAIGMGSSVPLVPGDDKESRLKNRRCEFVVLETSSRPRLVGDR